jgi:ERCC4-type nuclease
MALDNKLVTFAISKNKHVMSTSDKERKAKMIALITDLKSGEEKKILKALKGLQVNGDDEAILPILEVWNEGVSEKAEAEIITFLSDIKSTTSVDPIMDVLLDNNFKDIHHALLTTIWNSKVDYSPYLVDFVTLATQYDFMITLECLTIIENLDGPFEEHHFLDTEIILREFAEKVQHKKEDFDERKVKLVSEIGNILKGLESSNVEF